MPLLTVTINTETHKVVPLEPTYNMTFAGVVWYAKYGHDSMSQSDCAELYKAMIAAAPTYKED